MRKVERVEWAAGLFCTCASLSLVTGGINNEMESCYHSCGVPDAFASCKERDRNTRKSLKRFGREETGRTFMSG
jgi:hypothetical protein